MVAYIAHTCSPMKASTKATRQLRSTWSMPYTYTCHAHVRGCTCMGYMFEGGEAAQLDLVEQLGLADVLGVPAGRREKVKIMREGEIR